MAGSGAVDWTARLGSGQVRSEVRSGQVRALDASQRLWVQAVRLQVVHGQHQARAPHHQLVVGVRQLAVQLVQAAAAAGVGARGVRADRDVAVRQVDVAVRQDQVRVVVLQLALVLGGERRGLRSNPAFFS